MVNGYIVMFRFGNSCTKHELPCARPLPPPPPKQRFPQKKKPFNQTFKDFPFPPLLSPTGSRTKQKKFFGVNMSGAPFCAAVSKVAASKKKLKLFVLFSLACSFSFFGSFFIVDSGHVHDNCSLLLLFLPSQTGWAVLVTRFPVKNKRQGKTGENFIKVCINDCIGRTGERECWIFLLR